MLSVSTNDGALKHLLLYLEMCRQDVIVNADWYHLRQINDVFHKNEIAKILIFLKAYVVLVHYILFNSNLLPVMK